MRNTNFTRTSTLLSLLLLPFGALAQTGKLSGQDIKEVLSGASIQLNTPFGTTIPISFGNDGIISGKAGRLETYLGSSDDRGRWWISNNKLCFKWFKWLNSEPQCLSLELNDHHISWVLDDGVKGTAILEDKPKDDKKYILKSAPKLAQRSVPSLKSQLAKSEDYSHNRIFSVGMRLSQALRSDRKHSARSPMLINESFVENNLPSEKTVSLSQMTQKNVIIKSNIEKNYDSEKSPPSRLDPLKENHQNQNSSEKYFAVAGLENGDTLNIRSGPSPEQSVIGVIPHNTIKIKLLGPCRNFWCKVQYKNVNGWVNRYYLAESIPLQAANYN